MLSDLSADPNSEQKTIDPLQNEFAGGSLAYLACINNYTDVPPLRSTHEDCNGLKVVLENRHGFKAAIVYDPGKQALLDLLQKMQAESTAESRVIFYFAGHGVADGTDQFDRPRGFLLPADAKRGIEDTYIEMAFVMEVLKNLKCRHLLIILDCCYAGAFRFAERTRSIGAEVPKTLYRQKFDYYVKASVKQVITSASYDQKAADALGNRGELSNTSRSPFADSLIRALDKGDADLAFGDIKADGIITGSEMGFYLSMMVSQLLSGSDIPLANQQTPSVFNISDQAKGEFIFINSAGAIARLANIVDRNPYKGLVDYSVNDNNLFYGRQRVMNGWWEGKVLHEGLLKIITAQKSATAHKYYRVLVTGRSGSGKSSLVKAGVLGKLQQADKDAVHIIKPGSTPFATYKILLQQINAAEKIQYLLVDQYEELITLCNDAAERKSFKNMLSTIADNKKAVVIITLRSDIERRFTDSGFIGKPGNENIFRFVVPLFTREEIKEVVLQPASQQMLEFRSKEGSDKANEAFINRIVDEAFANPDSLPLLSFALSRLYEKRDGINLTEAEYDDFGGISGILDNKFTEAYKMYAPGAKTAPEQHPSNQQLFRQLVLRMISLEAGAMAKRRIYTSFTTNGKLINELEFKRGDITEAIRKIKDGLVEQRLLKTATEKDDQVTAVSRAGENDNAYVEPAHEALLRSSTLLAEWQNEQTVSAISFQNKVLLLRSLSDIAQAYFFEPKSGDRKGLRWKDDPRLAYVQKLVKNNELCLNKTEEDFVQDSLKAKSRAKIITRSVVAFMFLSAIVILVVLYIQGKDTDNRLAQNYWNNSMEASGENDKLKSLLFLANAVEINTDEKVNDLMQFQLNHFFPTYLLTGLLDAKAHINSFQLSADEKKIFIITDSAAGIWDVATGKNLFTIQQKIKSGLLYQDGRRLFIQLDSVIECWDIASRQKIKSFAIFPNSIVFLLSNVNKILVQQQGKIFMLDTNFTRSSWELDGSGATITSDQNKIIFHALPRDNTSASDGDDRLSAWDISGDHPHVYYEGKNPIESGWIVSGKTGRFLMVVGMGATGSSMIIIDTKIPRQLKIQCDGYPALWKFNETEDEAIFADDYNFFIIDLKKFTYKNTQDLRVEPNLSSGFNFRSMSFFPAGSPYRDSILIDKTDLTAMWNRNDGKMGKPFNFTETYTTWSFFDSVNSRIVNLAENGHLRFFNMGGEMSGLSFFMADRPDQYNTRLSTSGKRLFAAAGNLIYQYDFFETPPEKVILHNALYSFFSKNGKYNFTIDKDYNARIWNLSGTEATPAGSVVSLQNLPFSQTTIESVKISDDGKQVFFALKDGSLYQLDFLQQIYRKTGQLKENSFVYELLESKKQTLFCGDSGYVHSVDWNTGKSTAIFKLERGSRNIRFNPDGNKLLFISENRPFTEQNFNGQKITMSPGTDLVNNYVYYNEYLDSNRLLSINEHQIEVRDLKKLTSENIGENFHVSKTVNKVFVNNEKTKVVVVSDGGNVTMFDIATKKIILSVRIKEPGIRDTYSISMDQEHKRLSFMFKDVILFIDVATGKKSVRNYRPLFGNNASPAGAFSGKNFYYFDGSSVKCMGADMDMLPDLFQQQAIALTGTRLNEITKEAGALPQNELIKLRNEYQKAAEEHYENCNFKEFNVWKRMHTGKVN